MLLPAKHTEKKLQNADLNRYTVPQNQRRSLTDQSKIFPVHFFLKDICNKSKPRRKIWKNQNNEKLTSTESIRESNTTKYPEKDTQSGI